MIRYDFLPFTEELDEPFGRLFRQEGFERSPDYLRWAFRSSRRRGWASVARDLERGEEVVGVMAMIPMAIAAGETRLESFQAVDLVVDPGYRGRGVFSGLAKALLDGAAGLGAQLVWGFPNESAAHAWFNRFGWVRLGLVPFMVRPLRTGFFMRRIAAPLARLDLPLVPAARPLAAFREIRRFGPEADRLWDHVAPRLGCAAVRDSDWLNWRLFDRPGACYRTVGAFDADGEMTAFVSSTIVPRFGGKMLYLLEALGRDGSAPLSALIRHELAVAAAQGAEAALCWCPSHAPNRKAHRRAGFLPLPARLRPTRTYLGVKPLGDLPPEAVSKESWYVSYLDFDAI